MRNFLFLIGGLLGGWSIGMIAGYFGCIIAIPTLGHPGIELFACEIGAGLLGVISIPFGVLLGIYIISRLIKIKIRYLYLILVAMILSCVLILIEGMSFFGGAVLSSFILVAAAHFLTVKQSSNKISMEK